jgi:hypothetical protein
MAAASTWYQEQAAGVGDESIAERESAYDAITARPEPCRKCQKGFCSYRLTRFTNDACFVGAVMHNSRKPGYWDSRI